MLQQSACAKIILVGEHAVVYGVPAIAVPVSSLRAFAHAVPAETFEIRAQDLGKRLSLDADEPLAHLARLTLERLGCSQAPAFAIEVHSQIPVASGLGSGAAISAAVARAICAGLGQSLDNDALNALVYEIERFYHGTPSGIDNTVIVYEQPIWFVRGQGIETLSVGTEFSFVVADTGVPAPTYESVGDVRRLYETQAERIQPILERIRAISQQARHALAQGDAIGLGRLMNENQECLEALTVSSPELERLVQAARHAGALGAKLSGGGRGGNMLALVTPETAETVHTELLKAGAKRAFITRIQHKVAP